MDRLTFKNCMKRTFATKAQRHKFTNSPGPWGLGVLVVETVNKQCQPAS